MNRTPAIVSAVILAVMFTAIGFVWGRGTAPDASQCYECCPEDEMCVEKDDWLKTEIGLVDETAASAELSKMLDACEAKNRPNWDELNKLTKAGLKLAECHGALKECQRK